MKAECLKTEHMTCPLGIQTPFPTLSWIPEGKQSAYEVQVLSEEKPVWESGKVQSALQGISCGYSAGSRERICWRVRLWDEQGVPGDWSEAWYEMGLLKEEDWKAAWINPEGKEKQTGRQPASVLRKSFRARPAKKARLYITCHGLYAAYLNRQRVGNFVLAPGTDNYRKRLQYQVYDVTELLREENELVVLLGDGWYRGNVGVDGLNHYFGKDLALLCQMEADGETILVSDESWEASQEGPVRENDLQLGEVYDARKEKVTLWHPVRKEKFPYDNLTLSGSVPIREQERFSGKVFRTPNGETVIDFGQNLAGYTKISVKAREGDTLVLWHGETLDRDGNFTQSNFDPGKRNKNGGIPQKIKLICKEGRNTYKPFFSIFGFRYAKVETQIDLTEAEFTAIAVYSEIPQTAFFSCGREEVNQLFQNSLWSMRSNFCDIPTDCPTRERAGWTGDIAIFAPTAVMLADCVPVLRKWLAECRVEQGKDGLVQNIAPVNNSGSVVSKLLQGSAGWGDACVLVPWAMYEVTGDTALLRENYDMMKRWLDFVGRRAQRTRSANRKNPYRKFLVDYGFHFGEYGEPDVDNLESMKRIMSCGAPEVATGFYYRSASLVSKIAEILGETEDAKKYGEISENARKAYRFACMREGEIHSERQAEYVRPIVFGLLEEKEKKKAADALDALVRQNGNHLNTGFLSTPDLCFALAQNGHADTAYALLLQQESPSWLYAVVHGATTIWENWDAVLPDGTPRPSSLNHYAFGAISGWLLRGVCGIEMHAGKLMLCPCPSRELSWAEATWKSPFGTIVSKWRYEGEELVLDAEVPPNLLTLFRLPDGTQMPVENGEIHIRVPA